MSPNPSPERVPHAPMVSVGSSGWTSVKQTTAPWLNSLQMVSKKASSMCTIEVQGRPDRGQCPPGTLADKVQAQQSIWGL